MSAATPESEQARVAQEAALQLAPILHEALKLSLNLVELQEGKRSAATQVMQQEVAAAVQHPAASQFEGPRGMAWLQAFTPVAHSAMLLGSKEHTDILMRRKATFKKLPEHVRAAHAEQHTSAAARLVTQVVAWFTLRTLVEEVYALLQATASHGGVASYSYARHADLQVGYDIERIIAKQRFARAIDPAADEDNVWDVVQQTRGCNEPGVLAVEAAEQLQLQAAAVWLKAALRSPASCAVPSAGVCLLKAVDRRAVQKHLAFEGDAVRLRMRKALARALTREDLRRWMLRTNVPRLTEVLHAAGITVQQVQGLVPEREAREHICTQLQQVAGTAPATPSATSPATPVTSCAAQPPAGEQQQQQHQHVLASSISAGDAGTYTGCDDEEVDLEALLRALRGD